MTNPLIHPTEIAHYEHDPIRSIDRLTADIDFMIAIRMMMTNDDFEIDDDIRDQTNRHLDLERAQIALRALNRDDLTDMLLSHSLCPLHRLDYAICFDDDDPECAAIRTIHPSHDT